MRSDPDAIARLLRTRLEDGPLDLPVAGSSMAGVIASGSTVRLERGRPRRGEIWSFVDDGGQVVVHRIREYDGSLVVGRGTGNPLDDEPVPVDRLVGRVAAATLDGRVRHFGSLDRVRSRIEFALRKRLRRLRRRRSVG